MRDVFSLCLLAVLAVTGDAVQREHPSWPYLLPQGSSRAHATSTGLTVASEVFRVLARSVSDVVEVAQCAQDLREPCTRVVEQVPADEVDVAALRYRPPGVQRIRGVITPVWIPVSGCCVTLSEGRAPPGWKAPSLGLTTLVASSSEVTLEKNAV